jgi:hypothetical protein
VCSIVRVWVVDYAVDAPMPMPTMAAATAMIAVFTDVLLWWWFAAGVSPATYHL